VIRDVRLARFWNCVYYYTGRRCKNGHLSPRFTSNKACVSCETIRRTVLTPEAKQHLREQRKRHDEARKDRKRQYARIWYRRNKERLKTQRQAHPNYRRRIRSANEQYRKAKRNAYIYTHDLEIQRRIDTIYEEMRQLNEAGGDYVVDHIIPIQNELVCGLHVPWNLKVITRIDNSTKGNDFDPDHDFLGKKNPDPSGLETGWGEPVRESQ
jgi:hypothetical protein